MKYVTFAVLASTAWMGFAHAVQASEIAGSLRERGTRKPLEGVNVFLLPQTAEGQSAGPALKATTDSQGAFRIENAPDGPFKWVVNQSGYERLEIYGSYGTMGGSGGANAPTPTELFLEKSSYLVYETTIYDKTQKRDDKTRAITRDQISKLAGASNDPIKAVQNLPGVNRVSGFSSQVVIEGSSPQDTGYLIDGHSVPLVFHFSGLTTIVPPESVERVELLTSGFGSEYGRSQAGLVSVWLKNPATDRLHGLAYVDVFNLGALVEGPITPKSSFLLSARKSYIGAVLKTVAEGNKDFDLSVAPDFNDLTGIYQAEITPIDQFRLVALGSLDQLRFILNEPVKSDPALRGDFSSRTSFFRLIPQWTHRHGERTKTRFSFGLGKDWLRLDTGDNYFHLQTWQLTTRGETEHAFSPLWRTFIGFDHAFSWADVALELPKAYGAGGVSNPFSVGETRTVGIHQANTQLGAYWRNEVRFSEEGRWTLVPAIRMDYYSQTGEFLPEPRAQIRYRLSPAVTLRSSGGLYSQAPQPQETNDIYGNTNIKAPRALHLTLGSEVDLKGGSSRGWNVTGDFFYKHLYNRVIPSFQYTTASDGTITPENFTNDGRGRIFGFSSQARYDFKPFSGWLSYTLSRSTRWDPTSAEALSGFDQTHNLAVVGSVELPRNWQLSARARYVTGNPFTPVTGGTLDTDNDIYLPIRGAFYSQRVQAFWQLDARVDKKWIYDRWILSLYLDIQNVTNHTNIESVRYSYDYSQRSQIEGLPFLPIFGVKGEF